MAGGSKSTAAARPGGRPPGSAKPGAPPSARAICAMLRFMPRHALEPHDAAREFEVVGGGLQQYGAGLLDLVGHDLRGAIDRVAGGDRLPAREGAEAQRARGGVAVDHMDIGRVDAEHPGGDLRQHGFDALPLRGRPGRDHDLARRADPDRRALERTAPGALDVIGESDPDQPAGAPRRLPGGPENPPSRQRSSARRWHCG